MAHVLVTEKLAERGLDILREAGHDVDVQLGLSHEELCAAVAGAEALIIRSATQVTDFLRRKQESNVQDREAARGPVS